MKLKYKFVSQKVSDAFDMGDTWVAVPVGRNAVKTNSMLQLNSTAAFIIAKLGEETTEEAIVDALMEEYDGVDRETAASDVHAMIEQLREKDLLD